MQKKGQITLFLVIAVVMLASFGVGFYYLINSEKAGTDEFVTTKQSFDSDTNVLNAQIQSCLEEKTLQGINYYGLKESSQDMINNYIAISLDECINLPYLEERGYTVMKGDLFSSVIINDYAVLASLDYPIVLKKDGRTASLGEFEYNLQRQKEARLGSDGMADEEIRIVTEDGDAEFVIPIGTKITDPAGNPIPEIQIKVQDRNVYNLANRVVVGNSVYEGLPDGATFSPAIPVSFTVNYEDKPMYMSYKNLMCAYYDETADIWRTYRTTEVVDNGPTEETYTVKCLVEHFTLIAVVNCGSPDIPYVFTFDPLFRNPIVVLVEIGSDIGTETVDDTGWSDNWLWNSQGEGYLDKGGDNTNQGVHLCPERMADAICDLGNSMPASDPQAEDQFGQGQDISSTHFYSGTEAGAPGVQQSFEQDAEETYCNTYLLQDWDADDDPARMGDNEYNSFEYAFIDGEEKGITPLNANDLKESCYQSCVNTAKGLLDSLNLGLETSGDGINDYLKILFCTASEKKDKEVCDETGQNCQMEFNGNYENPVCWIDQESASTEHPFNNVAVQYTRPEGTRQGGLKYTLEYFRDSQEKKQALVATPKTWGYAREANTEEISSHEDQGSIVLGGIGQFSFTLDQDGSACENTKPSFRLSENEKELSSPVVFSSGDNQELCSDNCVWTLNDPLADPERPDAFGKLRAGLNLLRVYVNNIQYHVFYAKGGLTFTGIGFPAQDECGTKLAERMRYLLNFNGKDDGVLTVEGKETNCLYLYSMYRSNSAWTQAAESLCSNEGMPEVNFQDPDFLNYVAGMGSYYCGCIAYSSGIAPYTTSQTELATQVCGTDNAAESCLKCVDACERNNPGTGEEDIKKQASCTSHCGSCGAQYGFNEVSPNGGKCDEAGVCTCPDILDPVRDAGCTCGTEKYEDDNLNKKYCCGGFTDTKDSTCHSGNMDVCCCNLQDSTDCAIVPGGCNSDPNRIPVPFPELCDASLSSAEGCCVYAGTKGGAISCASSAKADCPNTHGSVFKSTPCSEIDSCTGKGACCCSESEDGEAECAAKKADGTCPEGKTDSFGCDNLIPAQTGDETPPEGSCCEYTLYSKTFQCLAITESECGTLDIGQSSKLFVESCPQDCEMIPIQDCEQGQITGPCRCGNIITSDTNKYCCGDGYSDSECTNAEIPAETNPYGINCFEGFFCSDYMWVTPTIGTLHEICDANPCKVAGGCEQQAGGTKCVAKDSGNDICPATEIVRYEGVNKDFFFAISGGDGSCYKCTASQGSYSWVLTHNINCGYCGIPKPYQIDAWSGQHIIIDGACKLCAGNKGKSVIGWYETPGKCGCPEKEGVNLYGNNGDFYYDATNNQCWECPMEKNEWETTQLSDCPQSECKITIGDTDYTFQDDQYMCIQNSYYIQCVNGVIEPSETYDSNGVHTDPVYPQCPKDCPVGTKFYDTDNSVCMNP